MPASRSRKFVLILCFLLAVSGDLMASPYSYGYHLGKAVGYLIASLILLYVFIRMQRNKKK